LEEAEDGMFDSITSQGRMQSELTDSLDGDYEVVQILEDNKLEMDDLRAFSQ
jgi:hypothetical protein